MNEVDATSRMFSPWARRLLAGAAIVVGLVLLLATLSDGSGRKIFAALVLFAIAAANLLPPKQAKWFGKFVAVVLVLMSGYMAINALSGSSAEKYSALKVATLMGVPALIYLAAGRLPYVFGVKRPNKSLERTREG